MTETSAKRQSGQAAQAGGGGNPVSRLFAAVSLFVRQILDEMRKVVYPTGPELVRYTTVVVVFVMVMMLMVSGFDLGFSKFISWALSGSAS